MMDAVISRRAGTALLIQGDELASIHADAPERVISRNRGDMPYLFYEAPDLRPLEDVDLFAIRKELAFGQACDDSLDMALFALDADLSIDVRREAVEVLEDLIDSSDVLRRLRYTLFARPLPRSVDIEGAIAQSEQGGAPLTLDLFRTLLRIQPVVAEVASSWRALPSSLFQSPDAFFEFHRIAVEEGLFYSLATALSASGRSAAEPPK